MKTIWLVNYYAMPPEHESRLRTIKFAQYLSDYGYTVMIISSSVLHNKKINLIKKGNLILTANYGALKFYQIRSIQYGKNGFLRYLSLFLFHFLLHILVKKLPKPDYIIHTCLPPFGIITYFTAIKLKAKYIAEVLDLWPESFASFGLINRRNPIMKLLYASEKYIYTKADAVIFSMEGGLNYLKEKKWLLGEGGNIDRKKVFYINNGVDLEEYDFNKKKFTINDSDLENINIFKVIYMGSMRHANNLMRLIRASEELHKYSDIYFLLYGDGDERQHLENYCHEKKLKNIIFKEKWVDPKYVPFILSKSSLNILNYMPNSVFKYGGSQSKSFQYFASGKPVCSNIEMGYCPIKENGIGISKNFTTPKQYADSILSFYKMDKEDYNKICINARNTAKKYDYKELTHQLVNILNNL